MKREARRNLTIGITTVVVLVVLGAGYAFRESIKQAWAQMNQPPIPVAQHIQPQLPPPSADNSVSSIEGGVSTSTHYQLVTSPQNTATPVDPLADNGPLPASVNLDVPFTSQAPTGVWNDEYEETCEEASALMVDGYYKKLPDFQPDVAQSQLDAIVAYEMKTLGFFKDTSAAETAQFIKGFFHYDDVQVLPLTSVDDLKRAVANGYPVIVPAAGKLLPNPNFKDGGPLYHNVVVKGYTGGDFITNDPGTHLGKNFTYTYAALMNAAHDWNNGDVLDGAPVMIIVIPNTGG